MLNSILKVMGILFGTMYVISFIFFYKELKNAPECYYDKNGNFHRKDWFEKNNKTDEMFYDENGLEPFPYDYFNSKEKN